MATAEPAEVHYALNGHVHIAYQVMGRGPVDLVLFNTSNLSIDSMDEEPSIARFHRRLASFSRLIRFDRRGLGLSDPVAPANPPTLEECAEDALAVMDAAGSQSAGVFSGASTPDAILLAATNPTRVSHLVIFNGTARVLRAPDYPFGIPQRIVDQFMDVVTQTNAVEQGIDDLAIMNPSVAGDPAYRAWWVRAGRRGASPALAQAMMRVQYYSDVRALLPLVRVPTLVLHRRDYSVIRPDHGRYLAEHIPEARFVELPGADSHYWVGETESMLAEIEEFLTGTRHAPEPDRVLATVLFSDIVNSTVQAAAIGDRAWGAQLDRHDAMVRRQLERFRGREIKTMGDGFLAVFDGPARAIQCGSAIRDGAKQMGIDVRVGLHAGEVELRGDDIGGMTVNIGSRVAALAEGGQILVSRTVVDLVVGSCIEFEDRGEHDLKGVPGSWRLFAVA
jgi:class 3 adenylate cyclase